MEKTIDLTKESVNGKAEAFDPLDMSNYKIEHLPKKEKSQFELNLEKIGAPLAIIAFISILFIIDFSFLQNINYDSLSAGSKKYYNEIGAENFKAANVAMFAVFIAAIILWITEAIPNYLTSLFLIIAMVLTHVIPENVAYAQLGHKVMWLNILSFILASMLVKTGIAKRLALSFVLRFGKNASSIFLSFIVINIILSAFISATTAKAAILLPIFMVIAAVYGATGGKNRNNFGRNIILQNLLQINMGAGAFVTGSGANLLAASIIGGAIGRDIFFSEWMIAAFPIAVAIMLIAWFIGTRIIFPLKEEERLPQIKGGMESLQKELDKLGPMGFEEAKSIFIFCSVLLLWVTDRFHGISPTAVAFLGAVVALIPKYGVVNWNDVDIPWHLLLFSAGAYTLGAGFKMTDLPAISVGALFDGMGLSPDTPFWIFYLLLTGAMIFSSIVFQSKTMRALIFVPIAIGTAQKFGFDILSLAFPVALLIEHVYALPFNSKPAALLYVTDHYSWSDTFKFGVTMLVIGWLMIILMGETYLRFLGYTPNGVFGIF